MAIWSSIQAFKQKHPDKKPHVVTSNVEHPAVDLPLKHWSDQGLIDVTFVAVKQGRVRVEDVEAALKDNTCLVTVMFANNETGVIQPIPEIAELILAKGKSIMRRFAPSLRFIPMQLRQLGRFLSTSASFRCIS